jgi:hypothetical protein
MICAMSTMISRRPLVPEDRRARPGDSFVRAAFEYAQSKTLRREPRFAADDPVPGMILRADATIGTTGVAGWAAEVARTSWRDYLVSLAPYGAGGRLIELATPATLGQDNILNYPAVAAAPSVLGWVAEGDPIPVSAVNFSTVVLGPPKKLGSILVWSGELAKRSNAEQIFAQLMRESVAASIDSALLATTAGSAAAHAGLLNGVVALGAYPGNDLVAVENDLLTLASACAASGGSGRCTFIVDPTRLARLLILAPVLAASLDIVASAAVPVDRIIGIDAASLIIAVDQAPEIFATNVGTAHMSTVPLEIVSTAPATADPVREQWQTNAQGLRVLHWIAFARRRAAAVNFINAAGW